MTIGHDDETVGESLTLMAVCAVAVAVIVGTVLLVCWGLVSLVDWLDIPTWAAVGAPLLFGAGLMLGAVLQEREHR